MMDRTGTRQRLLFTGFKEVTGRAGRWALALLLVFILMLALASCAGTAEAPGLEEAPAGAQSEQPATPTAEPTPQPTATLSPTASPSPTPLVEASEGSFFTYYGADPSRPVVARGPADRWDGLFINPGGMLYHDGQFHMFRNGFKKWPGLVSVGYMTSPDGLAWNEVQEAPVFSSDQVHYVEQGEGADVSSVLVLDDGTWVMYFHRVSNSRPAVIGRATSASPLGPWTVDPEPVLQPGLEDAWDEGGVAWPSVLQPPDGNPAPFVMYYAGSPAGTGDTMIGLATSEDGRTWQKYDDPATTEAPFAESDPILTGQDELWATQGVDRARVVVAPEGWLMVYQGGALVKRGLAHSDDGLAWTADPDNPRLTLADFPFSATMWDTALVYHDGVYYYYTELGSMAGTDIYLAVHEGAVGEG
jgi:hypothetical protein